MSDRMLRLRSKTSRDGDGIRPQVLGVALAMVFASLIIVWFFRGHGDATATGDGPPPGEEAFYARTKVLDGEGTEDLYRQSPTAVSDREESEPQLLEGTMSSRGAEMPSSTDQGIHADNSAIAQAKACVSEGTPAALQALHRLIKELPAGEAKQEVSRIAAKLHSRDMVPVLLDALIAGDDPMVMGSAKRALTKGMDGETAAALVVLYDQAQDGTTRDRIESVFRSMRSMGAVDMLIEMAGNTDYPPTEPLTAAIMEGLSKMNTPPAVNVLLRRLDEAPPDQDIDNLFKMICLIDSEEARASLENAAQGKKEIESPVARAAAVYALANYPDKSTSALLGRLTSDSDHVVSKVAGEVLAWMRNERQP